MKKLAYIFIAVFFVSCGSDTEANLVVNGKVRGLKKGTLYLQHLMDTTLVTVDSLEIDGEGTFSLSAELESPEIYYLYLNKKDNNAINDRITFFAEPGTITINTDWNTFDTTAEIKGSPTHEKLEEYQKALSNLNLRNMEIMLKASQLQANADQNTIDSLERVGTRNTQRAYAYSINYALNNTDSYIAPYIAAKEIPDANIKYLDSIYRSLPPEVANSKYGKDLKQLLESDQ
ncbi:MULTISPECIES: DUF4369 domain-containing protein [Maribacter]|uniref:DUF4369 domain-containing protein n=1 Tax=Maribacter flavus TaxID=1658664 RepID=A0A5B2TRT7_9FLAO|nr:MULTISPECIES: DUF4369 domain-containing protein [Maribacter]KAA2216405.1 DUF4369 domain-containing protein [Maribacter flavus]MDC6406657.1 DUF4369 domain-containing protein [Maribacter sp. PR66]MEE1973901.1 DUF4369 domain-containing protein [Maribacter flavus]